MDNNLTKLVNHLERIFPTLKLYKDFEYFISRREQKSGKRSDIEKMYCDDDFSPPYIYNWYEFISILEENGLTITKKKKEN